MTAFLFIRHGQAEPGAWNLPDADRALTSHGRAEALVAFRRLADRGLQPSRIVASPFLRARQTAECLGEALGGQIPVDHWEGLVPSGSLESAEWWLRALAEQAPAGDTLAVVSHQPFLGDLVALLTGRDLSIPPASVTVVDLREGVFHFREHHPAALQGAGA